VKEVPDGPVEAFIDDPSAAKCSREDLEIDLDRLRRLGELRCPRVPGQIGGDAWAAASRSVP